MNRPMKPYWPRTLHLLPAHLQARDAYGEDLLALRGQLGVPDAHGVLRLAVDEVAGARAEIVIQRLRAIMPSGLLVQCDPGAPLRRAVAIDPGGARTSRDFYVAVPRPVLRGPNVTFAGGPARSTRYVTTKELSSGWAGMAAQVEILLEDELHDGVETLRVGRVDCLGQSLRFDRDAIPTVLRVGAAGALERGVTKLVAAIENRCRELVRHRADHPLNLLAVDAEELPALQLSVALQRYLPLLSDIAARNAHPHALYEMLVAFHGALVTLGPGLEVAPPYDHERPEAVFPWLFERITRLVEQAARSHTVILPFKRQNANVFKLTFEPKDLAGKRLLLVLQGPDEGFLRDRVPSLIKMASPTALDPLRDSAVRGVAVAVEFEPPSSVPRKQGVVAYRIDVRDPLWLDVEDRGQVQLSLHGAAPSLEAFLYGVERVV
jgi:type VI secretion system protein ImpJ